MFVIFLINLITCINIFWIMCIWVHLSSTLLNQWREWEDNDTCITFPITFPLWFMFLDKTHLRKYTSSCKDGAETFPFNKFPYYMCNCIGNKGRYRRTCRIYHFYISLQYNKTYQSVLAFDIVIILFFK